MNTQTILALLEKYGVDSLQQGIPFMVDLYLLQNPNASHDQTVADVEGQIKHQIRGKIGFIVDFIWPYIKPILDTAVAASLAPVPPSDGSAN